MRLLLAKNDGDESLTERPAWPRTHDVFPGRPGPVIILRFRHAAAPYNQNKGKNMIKKIAIGVLVVLAVIFGLAMSKPDIYTVERKIVIKAPAEKIIPLIGDFHNWSSWSPWEKLDPNMARTFSGAASGKGAVYAWKGNSDVGEGRMEITDMTVPSKVDIKLDFLEPFASSNVTTFSLAPAGDSTTVTWHMQGPMLMSTRLMSVFTSMENMIGPDFEKGLAQMKAVAEK
jgi:hypothetical protein